MQVSRLDLGVEVVYVPTRDMLVIHPDLGYAEALGAVMGTIPDLHPDVAVALVDQVTPRPVEEPRLKQAVVAGMRATLAAAIAVGLALVVGIGSPTPAMADFGETWLAQMESLGLACQNLDPDDGAWTCTDGASTYKVEGFTRRDADFYVIDRGDMIAQVLIFETDRAAERFQQRHPNIEMAGRVVAWTRSATVTAGT